jgi:hypothetical protein
LTLYQLHAQERLAISTFYKRIRNEYHNRKDFYALSYDGNEVIDAVRIG